MSDEAPDVEPWSAKFAAALTGTSFNKAGALELTFTVTPDDKYTAMPITDIKGRQFDISVSTQSRRVFAGKEGIAAARRRVQALKDARDADTLPLMEGP